MHAVFKFRFINAIRSPLAAYCLSVMSAALVFTLMFFLDHILALFKARAPLHHFSTLFEQAIFFFLLTSLGALVLTCLPCALYEIAAECLPAIRQRKVLRRVFVIISGVVIGISACCAVAVALGSISPSRIIPWDIAGPGAVAGLAGGLSYSILRR
jgi:hypothetical protein